MQDHLGPKGRFKPGQDFRAQRAKARAGSLTGGARMPDGIKAGPRPSAVFSGNKRDLEDDTRMRVPIRENVDNQDRYGTGRESKRYGASGEAIQAVRQFPRRPVGRR